MATRVVMAKLSPTMEEGRVLRWLKREGEPVEMGEPVVEVETDKANMEVQAMGSGVLRKIVVPEGGTVPTGALLGIVAAPDEPIDALLAEAVAAPAVGAAVGREAREAPAALAVAAAPRARDGTAAAVAAGRVRSSPLARRLAAEAGLELGAIPGTGPGGRVVKRDVEAALRRAAAPAPGPAAAPALGIAAAPAGPEPPFERVELSQMRKTIARRLAESLGPIPHFFLTVEIDMERAVLLREELNAQEGGSGLKIGINDLLVKAAAQALVQHPDVNVSFAGDHIRRYARVDVGIAVALEDGLVTPVLRNAQAKGLREIAEESRALIERARARKLQPEEYSNATFTISNLGMYGIEEFTAVINPPGATILAVGAVQEKPVVVEGEIQVRKRMRVTLSCDHRAVDGATGARFLDTFKKMLENPLYLVL
jgi:pyruvate dehydrogenase E2 component (dihydrolipoamide acetyltransferase)